MAVQIWYVDEIQKRFIAFCVTYICAYASFGLDLSFLQNLHTPPKKQQNLINVIFTIVPENDTFGK